MDVDVILRSVPLPTYLLSLSLSLSRVSKLVSSAQELFCSVFFLCVQYLLIQVDTDCK